MEWFVVYGRIFEEHRPSYGYHPENPMRLRIALQALESRGLLSNVVEPAPATIEDVLKVHSKNYVEYVKKCIEMNIDELDADTYICEKSWDAALHAFGAALMGSRKILQQRRIAILALVRPPGHHAGVSGRALGAPTLGFCIFNNIAGAARELIDNGCRPVVIIDIDVHHGNGTQEIFWYDPNVIHIDFHEYGIYPGTGWIDDVGEGEGEGTKINIAMPHYATDNEYVHAWLNVVEPVIEQVKPCAILVSAGFDAFKNDFFATISLTERFYAFAGYRLRKLVEKYGGILVVLEGGYSEGLRLGLPTFFDYLVNEGKIVEIGEPKPSKQYLETFDKLRKVLRRYYEI